MEGVRRGDDQETTMQLLIYHIFDGRMHAGLDVISIHKLRLMVFTVRDAMRGV